jgi:membrane protein DedA with SNARE-associated domain
MDSFAAWGLQFIEAHAQLALFLWLLLEEAGLPMPIPGDLVILAAGARIGRGQMNLAVAVVLVEAGTLLGASCLYWVARRGGRSVLYRYGKYLHLDAERLAYAEDFLRRRGFLAIVVGRIVPGLRITSTVAAGALGVPYRVFLPACLIGSNNLLFLVLGIVAGPRILDAIQGVRFSARFAVVLAGLGLLVAAYVTIRRRAHLTQAAHGLPEAVRLETAVLAGMFALAATALVLNLLLYVAAGLEEETPAQALLQLAQAIGGRVGTRPWIIVLGGVGLYVLLGVAWAIVYAHVERWLPEPDWLGGLLFALVPLAVSLFLVLPLLGAGPAGLGLGMGLVPVAGESLRLGLYGLALSTSYTVLSRTRAPRRARRALPEAEAARAADVASY